MIIDALLHPGTLPYSASPLVEGLHPTSSNCRFKQQHLHQNGQLSPFKLNLWLNYFYTRNLKIFLWICKVFYPNLQLFHWNLQFCRCIWNFSNFAFTEAPYDKYEVWLADRQMHLTDQWPCCTVGLRPCLELRPCMDHVRFTWHPVPCGQVSQLYWKLRY